MSIISLKPRDRVGEQMGGFVSPEQVAQFQLSNTTEYVVRHRPKVVLITTTINVPTVLELYRKAGPDVQFIVAGDRKTPHAEVYKLCADIGNALYLSDADQERLGYSCSEHIGWNCIMRRSIALLEALKLKPDIIVTIDDDNIPMDYTHYFYEMISRLTQPYSGLKARSETCWLDIGEFFDPPIMHRGFPYNEQSRAWMTWTIDQRVGVVAGLWYGDPDINAAERIVNAPSVPLMSGALHQGLMIPSYYWTPFNSQNTAYKFELAPLMAILPAIGRYDDIWASYIAERIMREMGEHVFFGPPFTWQERNPHLLLNDLKNEIHGMQYTSQFCQDLGRMSLGDGSPVEKLGRFWYQAQKLDYLPRQLKDFGLAWIEDLERVL